MTAAPLPPPFTHTTPPPTLLAQGAEARLYKTTFLNDSTPAALKVRPSKPYRHPILDRRLTRQRVLHEARCLAKLVREGVRVPGVLAVDWEGSTNTSSQNERPAGAWLLMEWIEGPAVRAVLERWETWMKKLLQQGDNQNQLDEIQKREEERVKDLMRRIGRAVGSMHKAGVIHGDLTTSNLILRSSTPIEQQQQSSSDSSETADDSPPSMTGDIVLIDFGLASQSVHEEDRAVDLYVLERAFGSTHPRTEKFFHEVLLQAYKESFKGASTVLRRLEEVRMRGRKRSMVG
ncbi:hypothetical protein VTN96DRAFT_1243 [Rasamsonia emersonii]|uniref:EKC/KEOPS complex subunit BUD32 n=1 Tax=Rasamsonia emersonii (strain ATCC 16479 / CBS 393.64 / IMI 116815) TaxID=1408163 RepID=A0A0F4YJM0_RASE3|nr:Non-specific serine/threonine protein kinase [Rasamsonia emersonii CBS 393.64]KKA18300.1 Non-specific serine/threonine protein kinase [Rasamsonia emersonii CBS 393.64]